MATRQEYDFQYTPLEGRLPGSTFEQQTEDAINDIGNRVASADYNSQVAIENSETAMQTAQEAKNTADDAETTAENAQASADTANDAIAVINNTLTEIDWTQSFTDENGVLYQKLQGIDLGGVEEETLSETASRAGQTEIANAIRGLSLELLSNNVLPFSNVAKMKETDVPVGSMAVTKGYYAVNDGGAGLYNIRAAVIGETYDNGSLILLDNGNVAELITDGVVNVKQFGAKGDGLTDDSTALNNAYTFANANGLTEIFPSGTYASESLVNISANTIMLGDAFILATATRSVAVKLQPDLISDYKRLSAANSVINVDANGLCDTALASGSEAHKTFFITVCNGTVCGFDESQGNYNQENEYNVQVKNNTGVIERATYGVIPHPDNSHGVIITTNCTYAVNVTGTQFECHHIHAWNENIRDDEVTAVILIHGSTRLAQIDFCYQDGMKYLTYSDNKNGGWVVNVGTLWVNWTGTFHPDIAGLGDGEPSTSCSIHIANYTAGDDGLSRFYTRRASVALIVDQIRYVSGDSQLFNDCNALPQGGTFYLKAGASHAPVAGTATVVRCIYSTTYSIQIAFVLNTDIYYRQIGSWSGASWSAWKLVSHLDGQAAEQAASTASDVAGVVSDLNALITKLKNAGIMKSS